MYERLSNNYRSDGNEAWSKSPRGLADTLRRVAPAFRQLGFEFVIGEKRTAQGYWCEIKRLPEQSDSSYVRDELDERNFEKDSKIDEELKPTNQSCDGAPQNSFPDDVHDVHNVHDTTPSIEVGGDRVRFKL